MIGGTDVIIPSTGDPAALDICARIIRHYWPQARFEDAVSGDKYEDCEQIPLNCVRELFVYRDAPAESAWDADDANSPVNSLFYLILRNDSVTVVLDNPDAAEVRPIVASLQAGLEAALPRT